MPSLLRSLTAVLAFTYAGLYTDAAHAQAAGDGPRLIAAAAPAAAVVRAAADASAADVSSSPAPDRTAAPTPFSLRALLLAPAASVRRAPTFAGAADLLRPSDPDVAPSWLGDLAPLYQARTAVVYVTRFDGEGYSVRLDPLKLRCAFKIRIDDGIRALVAGRGKGGGEDGEGARE